MVKPVFLNTFEANHKDKNLWFIFEIQQKVWQGGTLPREHIQGRYIV